MKLLPLLIGLAATLYSTFYTTKSCNETDHTELFISSCTEAAGFPFSISISSDVVALNSAGFIANLFLYAVISWLVIKFLNKRFSFIQQYYYFIVTIVCLVIGAFILLVN